MNAIRFASPGQNLNLVQHSAISGAKLLAWLKKKKKGEISHPNGRFVQSVSDLSSELIVYVDIFFQSAIDAPTQNMSLWYQAM